MGMIEKKNYSQQIIDYLFKEIKEGRLRPGDKLKNERDLCEELGVSRPPLREALKALSAIGILVTQHGGGTYVNTYDANYLHGVLKFATVFSDELLIDYVQLRKALESEAAKLAAQNATEEDLASIRSIMEQREQVAEAHKDNLEDAREELKALDFQFHIAITRASKNVVFTEFIKSISRALSQHQDITASANKTPDSANKFHRQIYEAIASHRPELASITMYEHINGVEEAILSLRNKDK